MTSPDQLHVSYVHTPVRYAWDQMNIYLKRSFLSRIGLGPVIRSLNFFWKRNAVDAVICLVKKENTFGYDGKGDFFLEDNAEITRPKKNEPAPYVYSGIQIIHKRIFEGEINESFSFNKLWDKAIKNKKIKAVVHDDIWFHVGKPDMVDFTFRNLSKK